MTCRSTRRHRIDGTPPLANKTERQRWGRVCSEAYTRHRARTEAGLLTLMDAYGATNEAEFFAVSTESFFTRPQELAYEHSELYTLLAEFYRIN